MQKTVSAWILWFMFSLFASGANPEGSYVVVSSRLTFMDPNWRQVIHELREKHDGALILYGDNVLEAKEELARIIPKYACFVEKPQCLGRDFIVDVHRMTRQLDQDPYTDLMWGVLTGYDFKDALRIVSRTEPLMLRRGLGGCSALNLNAFEEGIKFSEGQAGGRWVKRKAQEEIEEAFPPDSTKGLVDALNQLKPHVFMTSGHATEKDWRIGYTYKDGSFVCKDGQLMGRDTRKQLFMVNSPNSKIFMPVGNCLIGNIPERDSMALALIHTAGVDQMFGYTAVTFHGYMGWGISDLLHQGNSLSEAFYFNNQALVHKLETRFPRIARLNLSSFDHKDIKAMAKKHGLKTQEELGSLWDRDVVAFYGDPAWEARFPVGDRGCVVSFLTDKDTYHFTLTTVKEGQWGSRPVMFFLPARLKNIKVLTGQKHKPLVCDNFILLPLTGGYKSGENITVCFKGERIPQNKTSKSSAPIVVIPEAVHLAKENKQELINAISNAPNTEQKMALCFLIQHMPERDLTRLKARELLDNVKWAFEARNRLPWGKEIPIGIFLNEVLPYANVNERRDNWREEFFKKLFPLVKECKTPAQAAQVLNREIFKLFHVQYHATKRPKPDQSPYESIEAGYASCTGLSILLADACRAVCVPARLAGVPQWTGKRGNHTWVEIWDRRWRFTGAGEYNPEGLDKTWFLKDACKADPAKPLNRIYAASFKKTGLSFPLIWNPSIKYVNAVDVTGFYKAFDQQGKNVRVQVFEKFWGKRISLPVKINQEGALKAEGMTRDETQDSNDMLEFQLDPGNYVIEIPGAETRGSFEASKNSVKELTFFIEKCWPRFHGLNGDNISTETGLLKKWPRGGPKRLWSTPGLGYGYSSVTVAHGMIFTAGDVGDYTIVTALNMEGEVVWRNKNGASWLGSYPGSRGTPTIDGDFLYHESPHGDVTCFNAMTGKKIWSVNILKKFEAPNIFWALSESLLIDKDLLICCPGGPKASMAAFHKTDGRLIWTAKSTGHKTGYASPVLINHDEVKIILGLTSEALIGVKRDTGELLFCEEFKPYAEENVQTPIYHEGAVFMSAVKAGSVKWEIQVTEGAYSLKELWRSEEMDNHHGGVILHDGYLYGSSCVYNREQWICLDWNTGEKQHVSKGVDKGSLTCAEGLLYILGRNRQVGLVRPCPEKHDLISAFKIPKGGKGPTWAHPVVCQKRLYIRHGQFLYAYDIADKR